MWFLALYLMVSSKQGLSAKELQRQLGLGSYKTAWTWLHKLRRCMVDPDRAPLEGLVEVDESYIGGPKPGVRGRGARGAANGPPRLLALETVAARHPPGLGVQEAPPAVLERVRVQVQPPYEPRPHIPVPAPDGGRRTGRALPVPWDRRTGEALEDCADALAPHQGEQL